MGKIVYLENSGNRKPDQRRSYTRSAFNGQSSKGKSRKNSDEEYRKFVAENIVQDVLGGDAATTLAHV